ncbi:MAG: bacteriorhodopsin [Acidimicrobiales bacterium]|nr:xanthorhodopsin [Acidimicrobiaceae bacterium]MBA4812909.1 bacteriorhodopsin [Acidimicrobiales bacterium]MBD53081.1 xanthorhodopsin [Acidimicrobiaceae bacterium]RPH18319.1 MAG: xanthorhodopsin [Actinobacteria bacterium TMED270]
MNPIDLLSPDQYTLVYNVLSFGTAVMFGAFVYFLTQMKTVKDQYRSAVSVSAVVVGIAGYHYFRIWSDFGEMKMNEGYRYADWLITVPLLIIELLIVLGVSTELRKKLMTGLLPATVLMIGLGYPGEVSSSTGTKWLFWFLAMVPFVYILRTLYGQLKSAAERETPAVSAAIRNATIVLLGTWMVYPLAYLFPVFDGDSGTLETLRQVAYTFADITAKGLYGLMIVGIAKARSASDA